MRKQILLFLKLIYLVFLALLAALLPCSVQGAPKQEPSISRQQGPTDPGELESFLDPICARRMEELHIPGAVFVLVKNGEIFFAKGYGHSNLEKRTPVIPDKTIFRVASITKLFTATAIMQLVERGLLNLGDDVNKYLKNFKLEENYLKPVTVANLLTHTGGFNQSSIGIIARNESEWMPLGQFLAKR
ncbi:MAG: serine hydrolase domain-containing protein, partial [Candidatus Hodarchaeota archaeon]